MEWAKDEVRADSGVAAQASWTVKDAEEGAGRRERSADSVGVRRAAIVLKASAVSSEFTPGIQSTCVSVCSDLELRGRREEVNKVELKKSVEVGQLFRSPRIFGAVVLQFVL